MIRKVNIVEPIIMFLVIIAISSAIFTLKAVLISISIISCAFLILLFIVKYSESKYTFVLVVVIILIIPVLVKSKLLIFGERTYGKVEYHKEVFTRGLKYGGSYYYSIIKFEDNDNTTIEMWGAQNVIYKSDEKIKIAYDRKDPLNCMILDISYMYYSKSAILSGFLLLVWIALYTSIRRQTFRKDRCSRNKENYPEDITARQCN